MSEQSSSSVKVAVRVRPLNARERLEQNRICAAVHGDDREIALGDDRLFTFDHVFDLSSNQFTIYDSCVKDLVNGLFRGYNATVLAYGQTGSGKTYTMGTALDAVSHELTPDTGVIPRAIKQLFAEMLESVERSKDLGIPEPKFNVLVQFVELYNEEIIDLLAEEKNAQGIRIHEDTTGSIALKGVTQVAVAGPLETLNTLRQGALNRTVGSTNMNQVSSRSHAIFTLYLKQERTSELTDPNSPREVEFLNAKFHFVDLAGSERLKRTGATGDRAKEGIAINCGLLSLGNVISVLGSNRGGHVPYRDSKLTRLLQDSLGGNSQTLMVACISPSDGDFVETLNTLRYANRAKNITNKVSANQDKSSKIISELRQRILELESKLTDYEHGKKQFDVDGIEVNSLQYQENMLLTSERNQLAMRVKTLEAANEALRSRLVTQEMSRYNLSTVPANGGNAEGGENGKNECGDQHATAFQTAIEQLERLRSQLYESESRCDKFEAEVRRLKEQKDMNNIIAKMAFEGDVDGDQSSAMISNIDKAAIAECTRYILEIESKSFKSHEPEEDDDSDEDTLEDEISTSEDGNVYKERDVMCEDLVDLQAKIAHKERVIVDLESSKNELVNMNKNILKQLMSSQERIEKVQSERDRVLANLEKAEKGSNSDVAKKIRKEYEDKLNKLRAEQKALHAYENKCKALERQKQKDLEQIAKMKNEVKDLRTQKVKLQQNIVVENKKAQKILSEKRKFEAKAATQTRKYENKIRSLETHGNQLETFTKRTAEIMKQLKRELTKQTTRRTTRPAASRPNTMRNRNSLPGKSKITGAEMWSNIEKNVSAMINKGVLSLQLVEELEHLVEERKTTLNEITQVEDTFATTRDQSVRDVLIEELASKKEKLDYIQSQIHQLNTQICDLETTQADNGATIACVNGDFSPILNGANLSEAKFLLQQLLTYAIDRGVAARKVEADLKNNQIRLKEVEDAARIQEGLLTLVDNPNDDDATASIMETSTVSLDRPLSSVGDRKVRQRNTSSAHLLFPHQLTTSTSSMQSVDDSALQSHSLSSQDGTVSTESSSPKRGGFVTAGGAINVESKLVSRSFVLTAHSKSISSVQLAKGLLLTGSKDRTARIFDLEKQCEIIQLGHHINAVTTARFVPDSNLVCTTSSYMAHIWDLRSSQCTTTLRSSGIVDHVEFNYGQPRSNVMPASENKITAACIDPTGSLLFTSFERDVRIWDLRRLSENLTARCINATKTVPSEITCLSASMRPDELGVRLFSGSKDHAVKVYDVPFTFESGCDIEPSGESLLSHDVISAVVPFKDSFFVSSHDKSVAKYNVRDCERDYVSTAHMSPVIGMNVLRSPTTDEDLLISLDKKMMCFWNISGYKHQLLSKMSLNSEATCFGVESDHNYAAISLSTGHSNGTVELYRFKNE